MTTYHFERMFPPLEGPRNFNVETRGQFVLRNDPIHIATCVDASAKRRKLEFDLT